MNAIPLGQSALLLAPCELFVFDFDGTVYSETDHFLTYGEEVAHFVEGAKRPAFLAELFDAHKPQGATDQFEGWLAKFQVDAARAVSIGDYFRNEIEPALARRQLTRAGVGRRPSTSIPDIHQNKITFVPNSETPRFSPLAH